MNSNEEVDLEEMIFELAHDATDELMSDPDYKEAVAESVYEELCDIMEENVVSHTSDTINEKVELYYELFGDLFHVARSIAPSRVFREPNIEEVQNRLTRLRAIPQPAQRTPEWHAMRNNMLTASNIWKVFGSEAQINSLIYEKCMPATGERQGGGGGSRQWGTIYEPVSVMIYEDIYGTKVGDFGCITHPTYECIGASPDGINVDPENLRFGRMIEIKNIVNRDITGIPKEEYWIQMQVQMETCDIDECDFVETRFKQYDDEAAFYADTTREYKGAICVFIVRDFSENNPGYKYKYSGVRETHMAEWIDQMKREMSGYVLFTTNYWYLDEVSCVLVPRNRKWFAIGLPKIKEVWKTIEKERITGCAHRAAKKKEVKPMCLIKLD
jgi:putative phage-type endonuclease